MPRLRPTPSALATFLITLAACLLTFSVGRANADEAPAPGASGSAGAPPPVHFHWVPGPRTIDLGHELTLNLPEQNAFLGGPEAGQLLEKMGNFHNDGVLGVAVSRTKGADWIVIVRYDEEGYVKDTEKIDAEALLKTIKEGTEESNEERQKRGFKALHVEGWSQPPRYDAKLHHLVWALTASDEDGRTVNFNTRVLGRRGIVSLNLVCDPAELEATIPEVDSLLEATAFRSGSRYEDFDSKKDKVAEYGLAGLILGGAGLGAAKLIKIGLLAKFWKVILAALIAGKKAIILLFAGAAAFVKRLFGGKPKKSAAPSAPSATPSPPAEPPPAP